MLYNVHESMQTEASELAWGISCKHWDGIGVADGSGERPHSELA